MSILSQMAEFIVKEAELQPDSLATPCLTCLMALITTSIIAGTPKDRGPYEPEPQFTQHCNLHGNKPGPGTQ